MPYIGATPTTQSFIAGTDYFNGTGSQTAFTLTRTVNSVNDIEAVVNNVVQQPSSAYTISGTTITFTSAPSAGTSNIYVRYLSTTMQSFTVPANSITRNQLDSNLQSVAIGRNRIINGAMVIDQRNAGASVSATNSAVFPVDRFYTLQSIVSTKFTAQQSSTAPTGFVNSVVCTSNSAYTVGATELFIYRQSIEGYNVADLQWGTANAKTVTLSFWVRSSLTGTFGGALNNSASDRSYPFSYTISSANTWEQKSITIAGDTTGTWLTTNGTGISVTWSLGMGSTYSGTAGAWASGFYGSATSATSVVATNGATFYITGVQLEVGSSATGFEYRQYGTELALCQRYYEKSYSIATVPTTSTSAGAVTLFTSSTPNTYMAGSRGFSVSKRLAPGISIYSPSGTAGTVGNGDTVDYGAGIANQISTSGFSLQNTSGSTYTPSGNLIYFHYIASAEL